MHISFICWKILCVSFFFYFHATTTLPFTCFFSLNRLKYNCSHIEKLWILKRNEDLQANNQSLRHCFTEPYPLFLVPASFLLLKTTLTVYTVYHKMTKYVMGTERNIMSCMCWNLCPNVTSNACRKKKVKNVKC